MTDKEPLPQCTFTEEEMKALVDYMNFVSQHAVFDNMKPKLMNDFSVLGRKMVNHIQKVENHIFEFKRKLESAKESK